MGGTEARFVNESLALRVLSAVMGWDGPRCDTEFAWLSLMSRLKFDGYRGFLAGARFLESLADWLQQFDKSERDIAYRFLREDLLYLGPQELQHLIDLVYPGVVEPLLVRSVAERFGVAPYKVWSRSDAVSAFDRLRRRCLFLGLSDGARIDTFRRMNEGRIQNDQVAPAIELDPGKWGSMLSKLQKDPDGGPDARFEFVFLLDDFVGSGTTLLRIEDKQTLDGKLLKLWDLMKRNDLVSKILAPTYQVVVHHYVSTHQAAQAVPELNEFVTKIRGGDWYRSVQFTEGLRLPDGMKLTAAKCPDFGKLVQRYYDPSIETDSIKKGKTDARWGFAACGLPVVLEHNTPNNSVALIWAESDGSASGAKAMRPLFRRRQRHTA